MYIKLLRNATLVLNINGKAMLVDPMLAPKDSYDVFPFSNNELRNPLVDLPVNEAELQALIAKVDAVLLTHLHIDHWDPIAQQLLAKDIPLFCQPANAETIRASGFTHVIPVADELIWNDALISRVDGQHEIGAIMWLHYLLKICLIIAKIAERCSNRLPLSKLMLCIPCYSRLSSNSTGLYFSSSFVINNNNSTWCNKTFH
jgi:L-ascorbate metabolism protein UlaG (beta-lactamase superfamily)